MLDFLNSWLVVGVIWLIYSLYLWWTDSEKWYSNITIAGGLILLGLFFDFVFPFLEDHAIMTCIIFYGCIGYFYYWQNKTQKESLNEEEK